ncbi:MAG: tRNA (adenosine(37)-N6)-dimethylallyltransferase MiaA [Actinobacteria bacterium]|nr:tRNA (adenosine(37)-N6)-dimethylallyltransferase MiaA [Actinomycetota bacterium]
MDAAPTWPTDTLLVIAGPTASGKTAVTLELAERAPIEVISADSRQVYRGLDVGTAKPTPAERTRVRHHGLDVVDPDETFSAKAFVALAVGAIADIRSRGRIPVVVGGTGFYIKALLARSPLGGVPPDPERRVALEQELAEGGTAALVARLRRLDPDALETIDPRNPRRLMRAIEIAAAGRTRPPQGPAALPATILGIEAPPHELAERIAARAERMFAEGLLEEAPAMLAAGYPRSLPALSGIGYAEAIAYLDGRLTLAAAIRRTVERTRQFARRQRTWFRHQLPVNWCARDTCVAAALRAIGRA